MITTKEKRVASRKSGAPNLNHKINLQQNNPTLKIIKNKIFRLLLAILVNKRIRVSRTGQFLPFLIHENVKRALVETGDFSADDIKNIESSIFRDVESMHDYETVSDAPGVLFYDLEQTDELDLIEAAGAVPIPNSISNILLCKELEKEFSQTEILSTGAFVLDESYLLLDIDERHVRRGFITPITDTKTGLITGLRVFRYPKDERPFVLRARNLDLGVKR